MPSIDSKSSTQPTRQVTPHPVAELLTDAMKARVRATRFISDEGVVTADDGNQEDRCPLAVAVGRPDSDLPAIMDRLHVGFDGPYWDAVQSFIVWADSGHADPADVQAMLGCAEPQS